MTGSAPIIAPSCAVCVVNPATCFDVVDGRTYKVCRGCFGEEAVVKHPYRRNGVDRTPQKARLTKLLSSEPGLTARQIAARLEVADRADRNRCYAALSTLVRHRVLVTDGGHPKRFWPAPPADKETACAT